MRTLVDLNTENIGICVPMYCSVFNEEPWNDGWSADAAFERLVAFSKIPRFEGLALVENNEAVAIVLGWGERLPEGWTFLIKELCVHIDYRRSGLATELMISFEKVITAEGYSSAYLETLEDGPSSEFYASLNYRKIPLVMLRKRFH